MAATPKPMRKAQKEYAKKSAAHHGTSLKEGMHKAKRSGVGTKISEYGMKKSPSKPKKK